MNQIFIVLTQVIYALELSIYYYQFKKCSEPHHVALLLYKILENLSLLFNFSG